jgi:hypothetical protein
MERADRRVAQTTIGDFWISTVFLGLDHQYSEGERPLLFETIVFEYTGEEDERESVSMRRYSTWNEAETGHRFIEQETRSYLTKAEEKADGLLGHLRALINKKTG